MSVEKEAGLGKSIARALSPFPRAGDKAEKAISAVGLVAPIPGVGLGSLYAKRGANFMRKGPDVSMPFKGVNTETGKAVSTNATEIEQALTSKKRLAVLKALAKKNAGKLLGKSPSVAAETGTALSAKKRQAVLQAMQDKDWSHWYRK